MCILVKKRKYIGYEINLVSDIRSLLLIWVLVRTLASEESDPTVGFVIIILKCKCKSPHKKKKKFHTLKIKLKQIIAIIDYSKLDSLKKNQFE